MKYEISHERLTDCIPFGRRNDAFLENLPVWFSTDWSALSLYAVDQPLCRSQKRTSTHCLLPYECHTCNLVPKESARETFRMQNNKTHDGSSARLRRATALQKLAFRAAAPQLETSIRRCRLRSAETSGRSSFNDGKSVCDNHQVSPWGTRIPQHGRFP
jgi:hypothetical protein